MLYPVLINVVGWKSAILDFTSAKKRYIARSSPCITIIFEKPTIAGQRGTVKYAFLAVSLGKTNFAAWLPTVHYKRKSTESIPSSSEENTMSSALTIFL